MVVRNLTHYNNCNTQLCSLLDAVSNSISAYGAQEVVLPVK